MTKKKDKQPSKQETAAAKKAARDRRNPLRPDGFFGTVFDCLASVKLAVPLLLMVGVACVVGTVYESNYTAQLAKRFIYRTGWFDFLLATIFVNVIFSTLSRYPWKIRQTGWLITHLGVLIILVGGLLTYRFGVEGNLVLKEGESGDRIALDSSFLSFQELGGDARYKIDTVEIEWGNPREEAKEYTVDELGLKVVVDDFFAHSEWAEEWVEGGSMDNPAVKFAVDSNTGGRMVEGWLAPRMPRHQKTSLGPAVFTAREVTTPEGLEAELNPKPVEDDGTRGKIVFTFVEAGGSHTVKVSEAMEEKTPIGDTEFSILVTKQFDYAYLNDKNELANETDRAPNPTVLFVVYKGDEAIAENQFLFANHPDFAASHGGAEAPPFKATYKRQLGGAAPQGTAEFAILIGPGDEDLYWKVTTSGGNISSGTLEVGKAQPMSMMTSGMSLIVEERLEKARREERLVEKKIKMGDFKRRAAHVRLVDEEGKEATYWQEYGYQQTVRVGNKSYRVGYLPNEISLGFSVQLKDFRLIYYPGSMSRPKSYESDVTVFADTENERVTRDVTIMMNEPMDHGRYRVFQSSYLDEPKGDPQISVFSIAYDPGVPIIYTGSIVMCLGVSLLFWGRKFFARLEKRVLATT